MALLRDDKVTVRRGGLTTARYREVMMTPIGPGLTDEQVSWLDRALLQAGRHLRAAVPAAGDPARCAGDRADRLPGAAPVRRRARPSRRSSPSCWRSDCARSSKLTSPSGAVTLARSHRLADQAARLRLELKGLSVGARPGVGRGPLRRAGLDQPGGRLVRSNGHDRLTSRLRSERYLTVLERLVAAVRAPKLAEQRSEPTREVLAGLVVDRRHPAAAGRRPADVDSADEEWEEAWQEIGRLEWVIECRRSSAARGLAALIQQQLLKPRPSLAEIHADHRRELVTGRAGSRADSRSRRSLPAATSSGSRRARRARREFVDVWAKTKKKLGA